MAPRVQVKSLAELSLQELVPLLLQAAGAGDDPEATAERCQLEEERARRELARTVKEVKECEDMMGRFEVAAVEITKRRDQLTRELCLIAEVRGARGEEEVRFFVSS